MPIELRIVSGARAGQTETFDKSVVSIGRHPTSDLRFDVKQDLDVSTRHGEIRTLDGRYTLVDNQSTNGTFVNGVRVPSGGSRLLQTGDTVTFGAHGPAMRVNIPGQAAPAPAPAAPSVAPLSPAPARRPTTERVAIAVKERTRKTQMIAGGVVVAALLVAGGAVFSAKTEEAALRKQLNGALALNDTIRRALSDKFHDDTVALRAMKQRTDSLSKAAQSARGEAAKLATQALSLEQARQRSYSQLDLVSTREQNDAAVVLLNIEFGPPPGQEATGFSVNTSGLIVTNRHVIEQNGKAATRIHVKFANSRDWRAAHFVGALPDAKVDIALIQLDEPLRTPAVASIAPTMDAPVGSPISLIGFPDGTALPMQGSGNDLMAKTTLIPGTVSKSEPLQLDSFATHGSSGSPVFDSKGRVIGVVWGGPCESNCPIVFAVPSERIVELIKRAK